jgi:hypothetical protein
MSSCDADQVDAYAESSVGMLLLMQDCLLGEALLCCGSKTSPLHKAHTIFIEVSLIQ